MDFQKMFLFLRKKILQYEHYGFKYYHRGNYNNIILDDMNLLMSVTIFQIL